MLVQYFPFFLLKKTRVPQSLFDLEQLDFKDKASIGWNYTTCSSFSISESRRNSQLSLASHFHTSNALVPAFNDSACPQWKSEGLSSIFGRVELGAIRQQPSGVVNRDILASGSFRSCTFDKIFNFKFS